MNNFIAIRGLLNNYIKDRDLETPNGSTVANDILNHLTNVRTKSFNDEQNQAFDDGYDAGYMQGLVDALDVLMGQSK